MHFGLFKVEQNCTSGVLTVYVPNLVTGSLSLLPTLSLPSAVFEGHDANFFRPMSVPFFDAHSAAAMYSYPHTQMHYAVQQQQALAAQQAALYGGSYSPALSAAMYGQQAYQQGYQPSSYPQVR